MAPATLAEMILGRLKDSPQQDAFRWIDTGKTKSMTFAEAGSRIDAIAAGLLTLGDLAPDAVVAILGQTSVNWIICDAAALSLGLSTVPIYASLLPEEVGYVHADTQAVVAIVDNAEQLAKLRSAQKGFVFFDKEYGPEAVKVTHTIVINPDGVARADDWISLLDLETRGRSQLSLLAEEREKRLKKIDQDSIATFTYTSGTTGPPKAAIQTHRNMLSLLESVREFGIFDHEDVTRGGMFLFLPLAHSFGRLIEFAGFFYGVPTSIAEIPSLADDLRQLRPGFVPAAPRVFEKIKSKLESAVADAPPVRQKLFAWAIDVGQQTIQYRSKDQPLPLPLKLQHRVADRLVLSKIRDRLGLDHCRAMLTGSAPISVEVHSFFLALGLVVLEAYGLTETCPGLTINRPWNFRLGSVGQALDGVVLRFAEDGEIIAQGPNVIGGYLNRPEATAEAFIDGWFHTGDLGRIDDEGFVYLTGRKKELIKTSGGKYVAPAKIEGRIKNDPLIGECVVVGDRRKYCVALLSIDEEVLPEWAERHKAQPTLDDAKVAAHVDAVVEQINSGLAPFETIKYVRILPTAPTVENGQLTASLKLKRHVIEELYAELVDSMFDD